eukprot:g937.t1
MASFVCGDDTGLFKVVNAETGEVEQTLGSQGPEQGITVLEWTSDEHEQLIVGRITGEVEVYDYKEEVVMVSAGATGAADADGGKGKNKNNSAAAGRGWTVDSDDEHQEDDMLEPASDEEEEEKVESDDELSEEQDEDQEASASRRKTPNAGVKKAAENAGAAATDAKHKQPNKLAKRKVGRFDVEPVFRVKLSLIRNKRDPTKNEKLVFACRLGGDGDGAADDRVKLQGRLLVLSSLGNGWILDTDKTQDAAVAGRGALDVLQQQGEQPALLKSSFVLPGNFIDPNDKKWQTSIKPRPCLKMAHYRHFEVAAGDVVDAGGAPAAGGAKPAAQHQLAYCGIENDLRIVDLATNKELWKAKNLPNDKLDLKVPIVYTRLHWAPKVLGCSTAIVAFTMDARVRIFDTKRQPRALFDFPIVYKRERSSGYSGCANNSLENSRPVTSSFLSGSSSLVKEIPKIGSLAHREYIHKKGLIRYLGACTPYGAAIRGLCQLADSKQVVAVGLGRFAVVQRGLEGSGTRRICDRRVYLKQKLNCLLPMPSVVPDADDAGAGRGDEVEEVGDLSEDSADEDEEENSNEEEISDIASELSYGSYVQEFDDDSEEESEAPPARKKRKTNKRK